MPSKYFPLEVYLQSLSSAKKEVKLNFERIEAIIGSKLPESAGELSWWEHETEGNHRNKRAWSNAGWRVGQVNLKGRWVRFERIVKDE